MAKDVVLKLKTSGVDKSTKELNNFNNSLNKTNEATNKNTKETKQNTDAKKKNSQVIESQKKSFQGFNNISAGMVAGYAAIAAALSKVMGEVKESINLFLQQDKMNQKVSRAFGNMSGEINDASNAMQAITTIGNEQYQKLALIAKSTGVAASDTQKIVEDTIGLSTLWAERGVTQEQVMEALTKASNGNWKAFNKLYPELKNVTDETEKMRIVNELSAKGMQEQIAYAQTYEGRLKQMNNSLGDLKEVIGQGIMNGIASPDDAVGIVEMTNRISELLAETGLISKYVNGFIEPWKGLFDVFTELGETLGFITEETDAFDIILGALNIGMETSLLLSRTFIGILMGIVKVLQGDLTGAIESAIEPLIDFGKTLGIISEDFELFTSESTGSMNDVTKSIERFSCVAKETYGDVGEYQKDNLAIARNWARGFVDVSEAGISVLADLRKAYMEESEAFIQAQVDKLTAMSITDVNMKEQFEAIKEFQETTGKKFRDQVEETTEKYKLKTTAIKDDTDAKTEEEKATKELQKTEEEWINESIKLLGRLSDAYIITRNEKEKMFLENILYFEKEVDNELDQIEKNRDEEEQRRLNARSKFGLDTIKYTREQEQKLLEFYLQKGYITQQEYENKINELKNVSIKQRASNFLADSLGISDDSAAQIVDKGIETAQTLYSSIKQLREQNMQEEISELDEFYKKKLKAAEGNEQQTAQIEKAYAIEKAKLEDKQRKIRKRQAISDAFINGALSITDIWAKHGGNPIVAGILTGLSGVMLATQLAVINNQKYAKGGILKGPSHAQGGILTPYGELEGGEAVVNKRTMSNPNLANLVSYANMAGGGVPLTNTIQPFIDYDLLASKINDKKVYVLDRDITDRQDKTAKILDRAKF